MDSAGGQEVRRRKGAAGGQPQAIAAHAHAHGHPAPLPTQPIPQGGGRVAFWGRVLLGVVLRVTVSVTIVLAGMALYHAYATWQEDSSFAPPGSLIDVDGHYIHLHCFGGPAASEDDEASDSDDRREPTVVFDHATMHLAQQFHRVVQSLREAANRTVRVCLVDRAGYGFSDPPPAHLVDGVEQTPPRTPEVRAEELFKALHRAGEEPPFVLVGHSSGGVDQLVYAAATVAEQVDEEVAGLVLIDPMPPGFRLAKRMQDMKQTVAMGLRLMPWLARSGILRNFLYLSSLTGRADAVYAQEDLHYRRWAECKPTYWHTVLSEFEHEDENLAIERHEADILSRKWTFPLVVIAAGRFAPSFDEPAREAWMAGMRRLTTYSAHSRLLIAEESGHEVPSEQPDLVAQAILSVLDQHRSVPSECP